MLSLLITSLLVATASAFPFAPFPPRAVPQGCSLAGLTVPVVAGLSLPSGQKLSAVTVGRGTQNYTCTAGKYVSAGAVADLYDVSCVFAATKPFVDSKVVSDLLPEIALKALSYPKAKLPVTIKHYFSTTPNSTAGAISPVFATAKDKVMLSRTAGVDAPAPATDVASLQLSAVAGQGTLAKSVFRLDTASGQPPASCTTEGEKIQVNYGAMYYFTK